MKPLEYIDDESITGVKDPITGTVAYYLVMGALGELFGLAAYLGADGLRMLRATLASEVDPDDIEFGLDMSALMATFQSLRDLGKHGLNMIKRLGLSFRDAND